LEVSWSSHYLSQLPYVSKEKSKGLNFICVPSSNDSTRGTYTLTIFTSYSQPCQAVDYYLRLPIRTQIADCQRFVSDPTGCGKIQSSAIDWQPVVGQCTSAQSGLSLVTTTSSSFPLINRPQPRHRRRSSNDFHSRQRSVRLSKASFSSGERYVWTVVIAESCQNG